MIGSLLILLLFTKNIETNSFVSILNGDYSIAEVKYILYDVNHGEGFNLRRDVFMRIANTVRMLRELGHNYILVLPPWGGLYHWKNYAVKLPWSKFFDIKSINEFIPVIEFQQFLIDTNYNPIDEVIYLQAYTEGWKSGHFEFKYDKRDCIDGEKFYRLVGSKWHGWFFSYENITAKSFSCISMQGDSQTLMKFVVNDHLIAKSLFIDRAEIILHDYFGDEYYWQARRSMRYANHLITTGNLFREKYLNSSDITDKTALNDTWKNTFKKHGEAQGGDYICIHWRRRDFIRSHLSHIPSIQGTALQILKLLDAMNLNTVFLSTDAPNDEVNHLKSFLPPRIEVKQFVNNDSLSDGEVAIIDQWICAHARYFIGSYTSTFSYRIQEDREILGFEPNTTFNRLCPDDSMSCEQPTQWKIVYKNNVGYL